MKRVALLAVSLALIPAVTRADEARTLAERVQDAVVAIDHRTGPQRGQNPSDTQARSAGFFVSPKGLIVTGSRFVQGRKRIDLRLAGGIKARANVVGVDPLNGVALLSLQAPDTVAKRLGRDEVPHLSWGPSLDLQPGQTVYTVGNAFDSLALDGVPSLSRGVVSSIERVREGDYQGVAIETDAAVNPGSFGGPMLDARGRVVGVVTTSFSARRWLGQAVPSEQVRRAIRSLEAGRPPAHGLLGVRLEGTGGEASRTGLEVVAVQADSGAARAGVQPGDRILAIDGVRLYDEGDVGQELKLLPPGSPVVLRLSRGGATREVTCLLERGRPLDLAAFVRPDPPAPQERPTARRETPPEQGPPAKRPILGLRLEERGEGRLGLVVRETQPGALGAKSGIQAGDMLMAVNRQRLRTLDDLRGALGSLRGSKMRVVVLRDRRLITVSVPLQPQTSAKRPAPREKTPGYLGVFLDPGDESTRGARVDGAEPGSPAAKGGLKQGDLIVAADGQRISSTRAFVEHLRSLGAGDTLKLTVHRGGELLRLEATLAPREGTPAPPPTAPTPEAKAGWLGVQVEEQGGRLVILDLHPQSPLAKAGVQKGDVITSARERAVKTVTDLAQALQGAAVGQTIRLGVERKGWTKDFDIVLAKRP